MSKQQPFTWVVKFTVSPVWVADGFSICDLRAHTMLANEIGGAHNTEISAQVLEAPQPSDIALVQGYELDTHNFKRMVSDLKRGTPCAGDVAATLIAARGALQEVINVASQKLTPQRQALKLINKALKLIDPRQGDPAEVEP